MRFAVRNPQICCAQPPNTLVDTPDSAVGIPQFGMLCATPGFRLYVTPLLSLKSAVAVIHARVTSTGYCDVKPVVYNIWIRLYATP